MDELTSNTQKQKQILENTNIRVLEETGSKHMLYVYVILTSSLTSTSSINVSIVYITCRWFNYRRQLFSYYYAINF